MFRSFSRVGSFLYIIMKQNSHNRYFKCAQNVKMKNILGRVYEVKQNKQINLTKHSDFLCAASCVL